MLPALVTQIPGPRSRELAATLARYEAREVTFLSDDFPIFWERAEGANVWDADGNRYLDLTSGFAVASLGHGAPALQSALVAQSASLLHVMGDVHPAASKAELCRRLSEITFERWGAGGGKTILANSGSEAIEAALKTVFIATQRPGVLSFEGGYHGLGYGALEAGGLPYFREPFAPQLARFARRVPYPTCLDQLDGTERQIRETLAAFPIGCILVEPVQGRGGEVVPAPGFLPLLRRLSEELGVLLVLDEIYTGFHRTGPLFACEHESVIPDIICVGKALTGGFPLAACVGRAAVMDAWPKSTGEALHTSTTLGNPLGCAMALASIAEHLKPETGEAARLTGERLLAALQSLESPFIGEVRGRGTMLGLELVKTDGSPYTELSIAIMMQSLKDGLILLGGGPAGNILSFSPSFFLTEEEISFLREKLQEYLMFLPGSIS